MGNKSNGAWKAQVRRLRTRRRRDMTEFFIRTALILFLSAVTACWLQSLTQPVIVK